MKLSDIKSYNQFVEVADIWYQRIHKIREVWQDESTPQEKRVKAFKLWCRLYPIVMNSFHIAQKLSQYPPSKRMRPGGIASRN